MWAKERRKVDETEVTTTKRRWDTRYIEKIYNFFDLVVRITFVRKILFFLFVCFSFFPYYFLLVPVSVYFKYLDVALLKSSLASWSFFILFSSLGHVYSSKYVLAYNLCIVLLNLSLCVAQAKFVVFLIECLLESDVEPAQIGMLWLSLPKICIPWTDGLLRYLLQIFMLFITNRYSFVPLFIAQPFRFVVKPRTHNKWKMKYFSYISRVGDKGKMRIPSRFETIAAQITVGLSRHCASERLKVN